MQSQQLLMKSQVFKDEVLTGTESTDQPAEEMSERRDDSRNHIGKVRIELCAKSFILQVYDVLARHRFKACVKIGLGEKTGPEWYQYKGLTPHDFRRSAVRNLTNAGVDQATAMRISGHRTLSVFLRYNIVSTEQLHAAMAKVSDNNAKTTQNRVRGSRKLLISRGSSVVEQPIRNRQVVGSTPTLGSNKF